MDLKTILGEMYRDDMTIDEINIALTGKELFDKSELSKYVPKDTADKYASEAADWRRKHGALLSDEEKRSSEREENSKKLRADYDALLQKTTTAEHKAKFLGIGYDEKAAEKMAKALVGGDMETIFNGQSEFLASRESALKAQLLQTTPRPPSGEFKSDDIGLSQAQRINAKITI